MDNLNLFNHAPKELVTDAFLTWLFYFLDSNQQYEKKKIEFFKDLFLKTNDFEKKLSNIKINRQEKTISGGRIDLILLFTLNGHQQKILFENKTWTSTSKKQLLSYKLDKPNLYKYIYLKLGYVNYFEKKLTSEIGYEIIDAFKLSNAISKIQTLHPIITQYYNFLNDRFTNYISSFKTKLFQNNDYSILNDGQAQQFLISELYKKLDNLLDHLEFKTGSSSGRPWTQLYIAKKNKIYGNIDEFIFWRIDIRENKYYIRLNQYAYINNEFKDLKKNRLNILREIALKLNSKYRLKSGNLTNKGLKESEIIIFFLKDNDIAHLMNSLPQFSLEFVKKYINRL